MEHNFVDNFSGKGLAKSILNTLCKFGFDATFLRKNLVGLAVDGQYVKLGVINHIQDELVLQNIPISWDMMHRIELMQKHSEIPDIVIKAHSVIHESMKEFMYGGKFEDLLKISEEFGDYLYRPKVCKTMKFASYSREVFKTFLSDYKFLVAACEKRPQMFSLRDRLLKKSTLFHILIISDIYNILACYSKCVQADDILPWEYFRFMCNLGSDLEIFLNYIEKFLVLEDTEELCRLIDNLPEQFFKNSKKATEMFKFSTFDNIPLPDLPVSSKVTRSCTDLDSEKFLYKSFKSDISFIISFIKSLIEQYNVYGHNENDKLLLKVSYLFNFEHLKFPRSDVTVEQSSEHKGFSKDTFHIFLKSFSFYSNIISTTDADTLFFEYKQLCSWFHEEIDDHRTEICLKAMLKIAISQLKPKLPHIIKFFSFCLSIPVSEAICESWGSVICNIMQKRTRADDGSATEIGTTDMRAFIVLNGPPAGYKSVRKILKSALIDRYGTSFYNYFKNISASTSFASNIKSTVVSKILDSDKNILPCFK